MLPLVDVPRVQLRVDDRPLAPGLIDEDGNARVALEQAFGTPVAPGWHFIEAVVERRGGRREAITEAVLFGDFSRAEPPISPGPKQLPERCDIALSASADLLQALLVPQLEAQLLPALQANEHMGPDTAITEG